MKSNFILCKERFLTKTQKSKEKNEFGLIWWWSYILMRKSLCVLCSLLTFKYRSVSQDCWYSTRKSVGMFRKHFLLYGAKLPLLCVLVDDLLSTALYGRVLPNLKPSRPFGTNQDTYFPQTTRLPPVVHVPKFEKHCSNGYRFALGL